jgi:hypothetical protein
MSDKIGFWEKDTPDWFLIVVWFWAVFTLVFLEGIPG